MEQAFTLPLPKTNSLLFFDQKEREEVLQTEQIVIWRSLLDKLADQKISWMQLKTYLPSDLEEIIQHPLVQLAYNRQGQSLLHLAVLQEQTEWIEQLASDFQLKQRRCRFGLTPFELARFLSKNTLAALLSPSPLSTSFLEYNNIDMDKVKKDFTYITCPIFASEKVLTEVLELTQKAKAQDIIPAEKIWMGIYFDQEIQKGLNPRLAIRYIDQEVGYGVFAEQKIPPCAFVGEYIGIIQERKRNALKNKIYCMRYQSWQTGKKGFIIDAETHGNYTRFINHSSNPNLALQSVYWRGVPRMIFVTLQEIPEGAQLTFNYGRSFWKEINQAPREFALK